MNKSYDINLDFNLSKALQKQGIKSLNKIQSLVFEDIKDHKDLIVQAQTGSGKTLAYLLPLFQKIDTSKRETQVLILAPTHELSMQIVNQVKLLSENSGINVTTLPLIGEVNIQKQIKNIKSVKPHIVVGTTGRILDLIKQRKLKVHTVKTIVLDEVDSLIGGKSLKSVKDVIKCTLKDRQLLAFSASADDKCVEILKDLMKDPKIVKTENKVSVNKNINHMYLLGDKRDKFKLLRKSLAAVNPKKAIVFVNDEESIEVINNKLNFHNRNSVCIYGRMTKEDRKNALDKFKSGKANVLVSSDLSARGIDIKDVTHVFNLDFPVSSNEYIHRVGRTARGLNQGDAISIITPKELASVRILSKEFNIKISHKDLYEGKLIDFNK
ncbi:MAG: DEAD/DEAH box helicase [Paeniclostridium sp.]|uniref:DEAD/DEAH box helicase n=1 Tax=Paraclostridium sordellii TaxID=1505 RepID=UPI0005E9C949|nr:MULTISPECIES: DEAD/DEAH box helicase [Paeniclostridium]MBW4862907.1 DEAD/DEAH box helicase [Paeniclostridium sp.]MBW4874515.1 DEAD/DEAH box helicase [Paeniclostridium sp.]CEN93203.1 ATP-dependent RNA helicase [[Clostridium] sordellii] [Paeniclostridium sordellii]CEN95547.1 ATP-dependent RNA helicase [[Clostridium] sordellii] [Paeniclostridium sordellii]